MKRIKTRICAVALVSVAAIFATGPVLSQTGGPRSDTGLWFSIVADELGAFPVIIESDIADAVTYDLFDGKIKFSVGDLLTGLYDQPVFCFSDEASNAAIHLDISDANGHVIAENLGLTSSLRYSLGFNEIAINPPSGSRCFYKGADGTFGLFGEPEGDPDPKCATEGKVFCDSFVVFPKVSIEYVDMPTSISTGSSLDYTLVVRNNGDGDASDLAFQEVYPANASVYLATLDEGTWTCSGSNNGQFCPEANGTGPIRFTGRDLPAGLPAGHFIEFAVSRPVPNDDTQAGHSINLHAGVVAGQGPYTQFDVAEVLPIDVVGAPVGLAFEQQPTETPLGSAINPPVVVHVVDGNGNLVTDDNETFITIRLLHPDLTPLVLDNGQLVTNGAVTFSNLLIDDVAVGQGYQLRASADLDDTIAGVDSVAFEITTAQ